MSTILATAMVLRTCPMLPCVLTRIPLWKLRCSAQGHAHIPLWQCDVSHIPPWQCRYNAQGQRHFAARNWHPALTCFCNAAELVPQDHIYHGNMAAAALKLQEYHTALQVRSGYLRSCRGLFPKVLLTLIFSKMWYIIFPLHATISGKTC